MKSRDSYGNSGEISRVDFPHHDACVASLYCGTISSLPASNVDFLHHCDVRINLADRG